MTPTAAVKRDVIRAALPLARPRLPAMEEVLPLFERIWETRRLTLGEQTLLLEEEAAEATGAAHVVAVSSATAGLVLLLRALDLRGEVLVPSFTFGATGQALLWNGLRPGFCDIDPETFLLDLDALENADRGEASAILAVNVFGVPPRYRELRRAAAEAGLPLLCDAAQGLGSSRDGISAGTGGLAEVFSLSPSKIVTAAEGGLVATSDEGLADELRSLRNYGKTGAGGGMSAVGLNARLSELNAAVARCGLRNLPRALARRELLCRRYESRLRGHPRLQLQRVEENVTSSRNYFVVLVDEGREKLAAHLDREGIETRPYFHPPLHRQAPFSEGRRHGRLAVTESTSRCALALPLYEELEPRDVDFICDAVAKGLETT